MKGSKLLSTISKEMFKDSLKAVKNSVPKISCLFKFSIPYLMYLFGRYCPKITYLLFLPLIVWLVTNVLDRIAVKTIKGKQFPIPYERFTQEDDMGEVSIEQSRLQEMILYVNDVENYLQNKHYIE